METTGQKDSGGFKVIQETLSKLQNQKNKLLEDLSLVRGKMQSQKTSVTGDPKSLQVQVHSLQQKLEELEGKISQTQTDKKSQEEKFTSQFKALEAVNKSLTDLSRKINAPTRVDSSLLEKELSALEISWQNFYESLAQSQDLQDIRQKAENLNNSFAKFKAAAKASVLDPEAGMRSVRQELEILLKSKDRLNLEVNALQLDLSKAGLSLDFLEREKSDLKQEKLHLDLELKKAQSESQDDFWRQLLEEENRLKKEVEALGKNISQAETQLKDYYGLSETRQQTLRQTEAEFRHSQDQLSKIKDQESAINVEKAKYDTQQEVLFQEVKRVLGEQEWTSLQQKPETTQTPDLEGKIMRLKNQLDTIGGMDELTLKEYQETNTRYTTLSTQVNDLKHSMSDLRAIIEELDVHIKQRFNESFHKINEKFEFYFRVLFNGGRAYLGVIKSEEERKEAALSEVAAEGPEALEGEATLRPEEKMLQKYEKGASNIVGIDIKATPPGKKLASIQALSGGERALTAIALLCSLLACFPSPFVVLDEVDAALDDANTIRFGQILGTLAHQTQFVTITHNRETMAQAHMLYGVTMGDDGISKLLTVKLDQAKAFAK